MFKKYSSIENSYQQKSIHYNLNKHPELLTCQYVLQEKIDGANFQIFITADNIQYGKRSAFLKPDDNFYGWQDVVKHYSNIVENLQIDVIKNNWESIRLFGELFGPGIQSRIDYCDEKRILIYDMELDGKKLDANQLQTFFRCRDIAYWLVPEVATVVDLQAALDFDVESLTTMIDTNVEHKGVRIMEGIVIKPAFGSFGESVSHFYLKKKHPKFAEIMKTKIPKEREPISEELQEVISKWSTYLNDNRLKSVFSKEGEIEKPQQMGAYIKFMVEDAKEDFFKDSAVNVLFMNLSEKEKKAVFSVSGRMIAELLKEYL